MDNKQKIVAFADVDSIIAHMKGKKVLVGGCFDVLHIGHVRFLAAAKKQGDLLIVALESDDFIQARKKRHPFHTQTDRAEILAELECVDVVLLLPYFIHEDDYESLVTHIKPAVIAITENDPQRAHKEAQAKEVGGEVVVVTSYIPKKTSSDLLRVIKTEL